MEESSGWKTERGSPHRGRQTSETMPAPWRREVYDEVENGVFERDGENVESEEPMATINRILGRSQSNGKEQGSDDSDKSDDEGDHDHATVTTTMLAPAATPAPPSLILPPAVRSSSELTDVY